MPKTNGMLLKLKDFKYSMSLDLNIGYFHIRVTEGESKLCVIILPWENTVTNAYQWD